MSPDTALVIEHHFQAFGGAACDLFVCDGSHADVSALVAEVHAFEAQLSRFQPNSELSLFNSAAGDWVEVSALLQVILEECLRAYERSDGLVNAAVHEAVVGAGYDRSIEFVRQRTAPVTVMPVAVPALPDVLEVRGGAARLQRGAAIDVGGVAKGWLADTLAVRFDDACISLGGDVCAVGGGPDAMGWSVGLVDGSTVRVRDGGVATSGTTGRRWAGGHHLIDPRTGAPAGTDALAVSVAARDCVTAEALAKAAVILGSAAAPSWLREHGALRHAGLWRRQGREMAG